MDSETIALTRLCLRKYQRSTTLLLIGVAVGVTCALVTKLVIGADKTVVENLVPLIIMFSFGPAAFASLLLFDYGTTTNLSAGESSCNPWVLRMPIRAHKIALVPVVIRTLWVIGVVLLLNITVFVSFDLPFGARDAVCISTVVLTLAAGCIWLLGIAWRPFANGWWRLVVLGGVGLFGYAWLIVVVGAMQHPHPQDGSFHNMVRPYLLPLAVAISLAAYWYGVRFAIRAISLAKLQHHGIVSEAASRLSRESANQRGNEGRLHASPRKALVWFLISTIRPWLIRSAVVLIPAMLITIIFIPLHVVSLIMVVLIGVYAGGIGMSVGENTGHKRSPFKTSMVPYLAHSPLPTATIAWTRMGTHAGLIVAFMGSSILVYAGWALWPSNREIWWQWATEQANALNMPEQALSVGIRWTLVILLGANIWLVFRWIASYWISYSGRDSWVVAYSVTLGCVVVAVIGVIVGWFIRHATSWDNVQESAMYWLQFLPYLVSALLAIKVVCGVASVVSLMKFDLVSDATIVRVLLLWAAIAGGLGVGLWLLIPDPRMTLLWCLAATILSTPLAPIMIAPVMMRLNRVR